jgi:hypothetical protein
MAGRFLEQLKKRRETGTPAPEQGDVKPVEQMSPEELDEAITEASRELLDARRRELRAWDRERAGHASEATQPQRRTRSPFADRNRKPFT